MYKPKAYLKAITKDTHWFVAVPLQGTTDNTVKIMNGNRHNPLEITYEAATWFDWEDYHARVGNKKRKKPQS